MRLAWLVVSLAVISSCLEPTQVTLDIKTDVPCDKLGATAITVGAEGETEKGTPIAVTTSCTTQGTVGAVGTYALTPKHRAVDVVSAKVVVAVGEGLDVTTDCTVANNYRGCIVSRRRVNFVPHRSLVVPVEIFLICRDVQCNANSTCNRAGRCVSSVVDVERCAENVCGQLVTAASDGLPCFNTEMPPLFCPEATPWCTRDGAGTRRCATEPATTGLSYQCRDLYDCKPDQQCVTGTSGVLSRCVETASVDDTLVCSVRPSTSTCPLETSCSVDAGAGLLSCTAPDAGAIDAGPTDAGAIDAGQVAYLKASNTGAGDQFGYSMALSADGNTMVVGAAEEDSNATGINGDQTNNAALQAGAAYVFIRVAGVWQQQAYLKASNTDPADYFGSAVAISGDGNTIAVGAYGEDSGNGLQPDNTVAEAGAVYVFKRTGTQWAQEAYLKVRSNAINATDRLGYALALSNNGDTLAAAAPGQASKVGINGAETDISASGAGAVFVFTRTGAAWAQEAFIKASNCEAGDSFGGSVALSGDGATLLVGASYEDGNGMGSSGDETNNSATSSGAGYVFTRSAAVWSQQTYLKASNTGVGDQVGYSVALSADGLTLALGARHEASNARGIDGDQTNNSASQSGAAYVFSWSGTTWVQQAYVKPTNTDVNDYFARSMTLSADGSRLAVASLFEGSNATGFNGDQSNNSLQYAGAVFLYVRTGSTWAHRHYIKASNTGNGDDFGVSSALSADGRWLAVGALYEGSNGTGLTADPTNNAAPQSGAVYWFQLD